jgi:maleate cis-trans isomerase
MALIQNSPGAAYGWRARIGLVQSGPVAENNPYEFYLMAPQGVTIVVTQLGHHELRNQPFHASMEYLEEGIGRLIAAHVDVIVQAGTPHIAEKGWGFEDQLRSRVAKVTQCPFVTDIGSSIKAMQLLGLKQISMLTPFNDRVHDEIGAYLAHAGIQVIAALSLLRPDVERERLFVTPLGEIYRGAKEVFMSVRGADGIWITGAAMPSVGAIQSLEDDLRVPVVTSMQAMAWGALRAVGIADHVAGYGRLWQLA